MTLTVGGQEIDLHLGEAVAIDPVDASAANAVGCTPVVRQGKEEIEVASLPLFSDRVTRPSFKTLRDGRLIQPPRSTSPVSYLRFESVQGDYIGQGKSYAYEKDVLTLSSSQGGVQCQVGPIGNWTLAFGAAEGRNLDVGEYRDAKRYPFRNSSPGIELNGNGRGCDTISGEFRVWELELKGRRRPLRRRLRPALRGEGGASGGHAAVQLDVPLTVNGPIGPRPASLDEPFRPVPFA